MQKTNGIGQSGHDTGKCIPLQEKGMGQRRMRIKLIIDSCRNSCSRLKYAKLFFKKGECREPGFRK